MYAFLRRESARGAYAAIVNKGAVEAGAIYIVENLLNGELNLYGPAPQALIDEGISDREFEQTLFHVSESEISECLKRQQNFDPDIWILETECKLGPPALGIIHGLENF